MSTLTLALDSPLQNSTVSFRTFTMSGSLRLQLSADHRVRDTFGRVNISVASTFVQQEFAAVPTGAWSYTVHAENFLPGSSLELMVQATCVVENTSTKLPVILTSNTVRIVVQLAFPVPPTLTVDPISSPIVTDDLPKLLTLAGSAIGHDGLVTSVLCTINAAQAPGPHQILPLGADYRAWSLQLPVPPGTHQLRFLATDIYGTTSEVTRTFTVQRATPLAPGTKTTPSGAPTTSSVTSWSRLEPQCADADSGTSSSARVFDPLWFMTRQWQMGEFQGEDAGTPIQVRVRATNTKVSRRHCGELPRPSGSDPQSVDGLFYDPKLAPLEVIAERRRMRAADQNDPYMLRFAVESGLHFLRMLEQLPLSQSYRAKYITMFQLTRPGNMATPAFDAASRLYIETMLGRALDGRKLATLLRVPGGSILVAAGTAAGDRAAVQAAAVEWLTWYNKFCSEPANAADDAWNPARLEYSLAVGAGWSTNANDEMTLVATEIDGSPLDWSSFDVHARMRLGASADQGVSTLVQATIPAPLTFPGAPLPRFWEMEEARIAYGLVPVGLTDIAHLMMINYASTYGNDWFVVPLTLPVGSLTRVDSLVVTDTFGVRSLIRPINDPNFSLWQPSYAVAPPDITNAMAAVASNCFFLAPTLGQSLDSAPLEDVLLMRDEMANVAWGIERSIESPLEQPIKRQDLGAAESGSDGGTSSNDLPQYRLATTVPANWIPFLPVQLPNPALPANATRWILSRLKRAAMLQPDGSNIKHEATTQALSAAQDLLLYDEEVPREGTHITRRRRITRWADGSTWLWTAFRNEAGQGEGSSGLKFDQVVEKARQP